MTGFYLHTQHGNTAHVNGDPGMSQKTASALAEMIDLAVQQMERKHECSCRTCLDYRVRVSELAPVRKLKRSRIGRKFVYTFRDDRKARKGRKK